MSRHLRRALPVLLLSIAAASLGAQSRYTVGSIGLLPARFYVGDPVEMYVRVNLERDVSLAPPERLPVAPRLELREVVCSRIRSTEWDVQIRFTSFQPGIAPLPPLDLGGIVLSGLEIETRSVVEDRADSELKPPRKQLAVPGTWSKVGIAVFFLLACVPLVLLVLRLAPAWIEGARALQRRILPVQRVKAALRRLARVLSAADGRRFFIELTRAFRAYLAARLAFEAETATTREIGRELPSRFPEAVADPDGLAEEVVSLLRQADFVKFGGRTCREEEMRAALLWTERLVDAIERGEGPVRPGGGSRVES